MLKRIKQFGLLLGFLYILMVFLPLFSMLKNISPDEEVVKYLANDNSEKSTENVSFDTITVMRASSGKEESMDLEKYVLGSVAAEMPCSYEKEALKAQAVLCRTYAMYYQLHKGENDTLTDEAAVHEAYKSESDLKEMWGDNYDKNIKAIKKAVKETKGQYLTFDGEIIKPAFFALSSGRTNSAQSVWGTEVKYLQSVPSDKDTLSPTFISTFSFTEDELTEKINAYEKNKITRISIDDFQADDNGYVKEITISGTSFSGEELRQILSLRSGTFTVGKKESTYTFTCKGYGHGVGMSQYGANSMAESGSTFKEILYHYFEGVSLTS